MHITKPHWPLLVGAGLLLVIVAVQLTLSIRKNEGHFVYALDDPYIHMAIARNFARHGVWGVTRYEFSSSTSSLLWTLLLAGAYLFTSSAYVPLILNLAFSIILLVAAYALLEASSSFAKLALLSALVLLLPLPPLNLTGMEHTAHIVVSLLLVYTAASVITVEQFSLRTQRAKMLLLLTAIAPLVRYESLFLIFPVMLLLGLRRRFLAAVLLAGVALAPLAIYGMISWKHGSFFLPNPLLLKGSVPRGGISPFLQQAFFKLVFAPHLLLLWLFATGLSFTRKREGSIWQREPVMLLVFILATLLHVLFAGIGWFYRYEAYLVALGIMIAGQSLFQLLARRREEAGPKRGLLAIALTLVALATGAALLLRANRAIAETIPATKNIYRQQYQMATFLQAYYPGAAVAANDIGAINFMADIRCLDLWGLGSAEVTRAKLAGAYNTRKIADLAALYQVRIALIYSGWFESEGGVPEQWTKVGQWTIPDCVVCGNPVVSFYAVDKAETESLKRNLRDFSDRLPTEVAQAGLYYESK